MAKSKFPNKYKKIIADGMSELVKSNIIGAKNKFEELFTCFKKDNFTLPPEDQIPMLSILANCYLELKNFKKAFENFYLVLQVNPRFELAHFYLFSIFCRALMMQERKYEPGNVVKKLKPIRQNLRSKGDFASNLLLGVICWMENKPDEMYSYLINAGNINPKNEYLFYYFAEHFRLKRDFNRALEYFFLFFEKKPDSHQAYESTVECYYEKSIDLLTQGKYEDAKFCLNDGVDFSTELIKRIKTKEPSSKITKFHLKLMKDDMFYFGNFILFDYQLERIFSIKSLDELNKTILMVYEYFKELHIAPSKYILSQTVRRLLQIKIFLMLIILDAITFKNLLKKTERVKWIRETRAFFKEQGFIQGKQAIDAIETFTVKIKQYKSLKEISEKDKITLLDLFRPAYVLVRELTLFAVERQKAEIFKEDFLNTLKEEIKRSLKTGIKRGKEIEEGEKLEINFSETEIKPSNIDPFNKKSAEIILEHIILKGKIHWLWGFVLLDEWAFRKKEKIYNNPKLRFGNYISKEIKKYHDYGFSLKHKKGEDEWKIDYEETKFKLKCNLLLARDYFNDARKEYDNGNILPAIEKLEKAVKPTGYENVKYIDAYNLLIECIFKVNYKNISHNLLSQTEEFLNWYKYKLDEALFSIEMIYIPEEKITESFINKELQYLRDEVKKTNKNYNSIMRKVSISESEKDYEQIKKLACTLIKTINLIEVGRSELSDICVDANEVIYKTEEFISLKDNKHIKKMFNQRVESLRKTKSYLENPDETEKFLLLSIIRKRINFNKYHNLDSFKNYFGNKLKKEIKLLT